VGDLYHSLCVQVPNETLMKADINNVSDSKNIQDRLSFEVDSACVTPEVCDDLADRLIAETSKETARHLFNSEFVPFSYIQEVTNPLKYKVRVSASQSCSSRPACRTIGIDFEDETGQRCRSRMK
jgi:hypothetical protein